jgi:hypothetical protein
MPQYTTADEVKGFVGTLQERQTLMKAAASQSEKDTFLSHSSKDNDLVPGVVLVLQNHGGKVYVDLGDDRLPEPPSVGTAQVLRETIRKVRRFVLLVSPNSKKSNWIPWELGLADGQRSTAAVALFPVVQEITETRWAEQEYLGLYRRIVWGQLQGYEKNVWMVYDHHTHTADLLSKWLRGQ